jgi:hypothetical protein
MASTPLRRVDSRVRPKPERDPDTLKDLLAKLVDERQRLRSAGAPVDDLERNRLAIVQCQWELSRALIARHLPAHATPSVA